MSGQVPRNSGREVSGGAGRTMWVPCVSDMSRAWVQSGAFPEGFREGHGLAAEAVAGRPSFKSGTGEFGGGWRGWGGGAAAGLFLPCEFAAGAGTAFAGVVRGGETW